MYKLDIVPGAQRDLARLARRIGRQDFERLGQAIAILAQDPRPVGVSKLQDRDNRYRIRVGSFRVIYEIYDGDSLVVIQEVGRRNEATYR